MRYIANSDGYLQQVSFGADIACNGKTCTEYTGEVPEGYKSLEEWYQAEAEKLCRWKIASGQLTLDSSAVVPVESMPPVVCEAGTSGVYSYRKWSDGTKECWCTATATRNITATVGIDGIVAATAAIYGSYPSGLFTEPPACKVELLGLTSGTTEYNGWLYTVSSGTAARTPQMKVARLGTAISSVTVKFSVYAIGK